MHLGHKLFEGRVFKGAWALLAGRIATEGHVDVTLHSPERRLLVRFSRAWRYPSFAEAFPSVPLPRFHSPGL